jgi:hypothetical protein
MAACIMAELAVSVLCASFTRSQEQLAHSHQQIQVICNAYLFWFMDVKTAATSARRK